jgi:hypothetical protein
MQPIIVKNDLTIIYEKRADDVLAALLDPIHSTYASRAISVRDGTWSYADPSELSPEAKEVMDRHQEENARRFKPVFDLYKDVLASLDIRRGDYRNIPGLIQFAKDIPYILYEGMIDGIKNKRLTVHVLLAAYMPIYATKFLKKKENVFRAHNHRFVRREHELTSLDGMVGLTFDNHYGSPTQFEKVELCFANGVNISEDDFYVREFMRPEEIFRNKRHYIPITPKQAECAKWIDATLGEEKQAFFDSIQKHAFEREAMNGIEKLRL